MEVFYLILVIAMLVAIYMTVMKGRKKSGESKKDDIETSIHGNGETRGEKRKYLGLSFMAMMFVEFIVVLTAHGVTPNLGDIVLSLVEALGAVLPCFAVAFLVSLLYRVFFGSFYSVKTVCVYAIIIYMIGFIGRFV